MDFKDLLYATILTTSLYSPVYSQDNYKFRDFPLSFHQEERENNNYLLTILTLSAISSALLGAFLYSKYKKNSDKKLKNLENIFN